MTLRLPVEPPFPPQFFPQFVRLSRRLFVCGGALIVPLIASPNCLGQSVADSQPAPHSEVGSAGTQTAPIQRFVRLRAGKDNQPTSLDTEVATFQGKGSDDKDVEVDLIATIHVADRGYYDDLNRRFKHYDSVLYELVAPEDMKVTADREDTSLLSGFQGGLASMLELEFQLDCIDYQAPNFVHADMTPLEFTASMKSRGESPLSMILQVFRNSLKEQAKNPFQTTEKELVLAFLSRNRSRELKKVVAHEFSDVERMVAIHQGPDGSTLLTERNKKALQVLRQVLNRKSHKVAIYYGAAHMPDMSMRLQNDFKMEAGKSEWLVAWDLQPGPAKNP